MEIFYQREWWKIPCAHPKFGKENVSENAIVLSRNFGAVTEEDKSV